MLIKVYYLFILLKLKFKCKRMESGFFLGSFSLDEGVFYPCTHHHIRKEKLMPKKPKKPCKHPGCPRLTDKCYCELHVKLHVNDRYNAYERGYSSRWQKASKQFLAKNPFCVNCEKNGKLTPATVVDHVNPHRGYEELFWSESNWQPLCKKCHNRKTRMQDQHQEYSY